jgi:hypothetical protein
MSIARNFEIISESLNCKESVFNKIFVKNYDNDDNNNYNNRYMNADVSKCGRF